MRRRTLLHPITIRGRGAFGGHAELTLKPTNKPGVYWNIDGMDVLIGEMRIVVYPRLHFLALSYGKKIFRVPEHLLGILYASGVDGVSIKSNKLPYDGCAMAFWEPLQIKSVCINNELTCYTLNRVIEIPLHTGRIFRFIPSNSFNTLEYEIEVDYQNIGRYTLSGNLATTCLTSLAKSRPYGRTAIYKMLCKLTGRADQFVWFEDNNIVRTSQTCMEKLKEIAQHRLLDLLGALMHVNPPGGTFVGKIISPPHANHVSDIKFLEKICNIGLHKIS